MSKTKAPVTTTGWYENEDGTVTFYYFKHHRLIPYTTVAGWEVVRAAEASLA